MRSHQLVLARKFRRPRNVQLDKVRVQPSKLNNQSLGRGSGKTPSTVLTVSTMKDLSEPKSPAVLTGRSIPVRNKSANLCHVGEQTYNTSKYSCKPMTTIMRR